MNTLEIRTKVAEYMRVGFTMKEAFFNIKDSARVSSRKVNKVAQAKSDLQEKNGTTEYGWSGKEYGNRKWGKQ